MRILLIILISTLLLAHQTAIADKVLTFNTTGKTPLNNAQQTGFLDEISREAFKRIGYQIKTIQLPAERGLKNVNAGIEDGEMSRIAGLNKSYPNLLQVPEKIMDWEFVIFSIDPINLENGWSALDNKAVSFLNGWKILERNVPDSANALKVQNSEQLFSLLKKRRTDYVIYEKWCGLFLSKKQKLSNVKLRYPALAKKEMFLYLHKKHEALIPQVSDALKQMKKDGSYDKIFNKILKPLQ